MPRKTKHPKILIMASPAAFAGACGLHPDIIYAEILAGRLECRQLPGRRARRILISQASDWYREHWLPITKRKVTHADD
jgi:hypothetical protein